MKSIKILFISDNFPPEFNAPATRVYEHAKEWVKHGAEVTVITCFPNFPSGKVFEGYKNRIRQVEYIDGIKVVRVWSYITANKGTLKRIMDYFSFAVTSFLAGIFESADVIVATSPQFFTTWSAFLLSKIKRKPWVFELRDLWPESIKAVGALKNQKILEFLEKIELFLYKDAQKVVAVTNAFKENLVKRGIKPEKIEVVPNGVNLELFRAREKDSKLLKDLNLHGKFIVGYIGTHGMAHGLDFIVRCASKIKDSDIHFLFVGDGAEKENVVKLANALRLKNVTFLEPVKKLDVPKYLSIIDVALVPLKKTETFKTVIPSKIFEASAMEKPCLLGVDGEARRLVESYECGIFYEPENEEDFLKKLLMLKRDNKLYRKLQEGCKRLAKDFDRKKLAVKMLNILKECVRT
jgi:glycosyltransferase involved in cell wall biosynthesis